jgi:hypothetical protein
MARLRTSRKHGKAEQKLRLNGPLRLLDTLRVLLVRLLRLVLLRLGDDMRFDEHTATDRHAHGGNKGQVSSVQFSSEQRRPGSTWLLARLKGQR